METLKRQLFLLLIIFNLFVVGGSVYAQDSPENFDSGITELSKLLAVDAHSYDNLSVAVLEFNNLDGKNSNFSKLLSEELTTKLFQTKKFNVIERSQIVKIIKEQKLQLTGPIDNASIKMLGKLTGVSSIITGTITDMQSYLRINARLISISTGSIISARSVNILKDETINALASIKKNSKDGLALNNYSERFVESKDTKTIAGDFIFKFSKIYKSGNGVICEVIVICNNGSKKQTIGDPYYHDITRIYSKSGKSYKLDWLKLNPESENNWPYVNTTFLNNIPYLIYMKFENVTEDINSLYLVNIRYTDEDMYHFGNTAKVLIKQ